MSEEAKRTFGTILCVIGILIMTVSGICSGIFMSEGSLEGGMIFFILIFGGIPFLVGLGMFYAGKQIRRINS